MKNFGTYVLSGGPLKKRLKNLQHCPVHLHTGPTPSVYTAFLLKPWPAEIRTRPLKKQNMKPTISINPASVSISTTEWLM